MLKYVDTLVTFSEIPDEISLCINISGCPIHCPECHSKYLWDNIGEDLNNESLLSLINNNEGITCVCLMGGDGDVKSIVNLIKFIKTDDRITSKYPNLKTAWYSGNDYICREVSANLGYFDYIKIGSYNSVDGPLNNPKTNQSMMMVTSDENHKVIECKDITYKFWKND